VWIEFTVRCKYLDAIGAETLTDTYERIMGQLVKMIEQPDKWLIKANWLIFHRIADSFYVSRVRLSSYVFTGSPFRRFAVSYF
jgi:hypothetical protein